MKPKKDCFVQVTQLSYHKSMQNKSVQTPVVYQNFVTRQFQITEKNGFWWQKNFLVGKTTIPSSSPNAKGKHFSKKHCAKQGDESKSAFTRFQILNNPCVWFSSSLPKGQRSEINQTFIAE